MEYKHIDDCWDAIRNAKSPKEVEELFNDFPVKMGSWCILKDEKTPHKYTVYNDYEEYGDTQTDREDFYF